MTTKLSLTDSSSNSLKYYINVSIKRFKKEKTIKQLEFLLVIAKNIKLL